MNFVNKACYEFCAYEELFKRKKTNKKNRYFNSAKMLLTLSNFMQTLNELPSTASITIYELLKIVCLSVSIFFLINRFIAYLL